MKRTPLKRTKGLNRYSRQKIAEIYNEFPIRVALAERCGGEAITYYKTIYCNHIKIWLPRVQCFGGTCENCHELKLFTILEPHEKVFRSHAGKLSLENTIMVCRNCHKILNPNEPKLRWIK
jgi:5-methylcytosine-specific restriction endonuclease McrA